MLYTYKQLELKPNTFAVFALIDGSALDYCALSEDNQATWVTAHTSSLDAVQGAQASPDVHDALDLALDLHYEN